VYHRRDIPTSGCTTGGIYPPRGAEKEEVYHPGEQKGGGLPPRKARREGILLKTL